MNRPARSIMASVVDRQVFNVGCVSVDPLSRDACWRNGKERLQPQTLKVLMALVSRRGEVITRDELTQLCWDGRIVGDDVINRTISLLRHLADRAGGFTIETVPRTGYRLIENGPGPARGLWKSRRQLFGGAAGIGLVVALLAGRFWLDRRPVSQGTPPTPSISVVSFTAQDDDPLLRHLAEATPISLSHMLSESGFAVVREKTADAPADSRTDYIFSGNLRRTGNIVEVAVQMLSKRDGTIAFSHEFGAPIDRAQDLPNRIGAAAAAELAWTGAEMVLDPREHLDPQVASELMSAVVLTIEAHDDIRAYQLYKHAAAAAPQSAFAQLGLAIQTGFSISSIPGGERAEAIVLARSAAKRARALAPEFGDVYLPDCLLRSPVRLVECDTLVHHALEVDSSSSFVPGLLSSLYDRTGRIDEALQLAAQSLANDPYKPAKLARMIRMFDAVGDSDNAERVYDTATRLWPEDRRMRAARLLGMAERGNYAALQEFVDPVADKQMLDASALSLLLAARGKHDISGARDACGTPRLKRYTLGVCMTVLAELGERDASYAIAAILYPAWRAPRGMDVDQLWLNNPAGFETAQLNAPAARAMRKDPRFFDLARRLGLLAYWRTRRPPDFCTEAHEPICNIIATKLAERRTVR